jgi:hypothetical protein
MTRNVLKQQAIEIARKSVFGDFIAVEVFNNAEFSFMIGMVIGSLQHLSEAVDNWTGSIKQNTPVIQVQRLQPTSPGSVTFFLTDDKLLVNVEHLISGNFAMECLENTSIRRANSNVSPKYKLDSEQHGTILRCLQKVDPAKSHSFQSIENDTSSPGDENFDHKLLVDLKLVIPCNTWQHEDARKYFGLQYHNKTTTAFVRKVKSPNTKKVAFDLEFPESSPKCL